MNGRQLIKVTGFTGAGAPDHIRYVFARDYAEAMTAACKDLKDQVGIYKFEVQPATAIENVICVGDVETLGIKVHEINESKS